MNNLKPFKVIKVGNLFTPRLPAWSFSKTVPNCKHCKYYRNINKSGTLNECSKFSYPSKNNGLIYEYADSCRKNLNLCGPDGYFYIEN